MKCLVLIRHAQSEMNAAKAGHRFFSDAEIRAPFVDIPDTEIQLTDLGIRQAELTGEALKRHFGRFDVAFHSGFRRTRDTLHIMLRQYPVAIRDDILVREDSGIRERDSGCLYNITLPEMEKRFPWWYDYRNQAGAFFAVPPGHGESLYDIVRWRGRRFYDHLCREYPDGRVLVVTHGETLRCLRGVIESLGLRIPDGPGPKNCGVTVYERDDDTGILTLREYNTVHY